MAYLTIIDGKMERHDGIPSLDDIYRILGGYADHVTIRTPLDVNRAFTFWVYEYGMYEMEPSLAVPQIQQVFYGPVVINVADLQSGDTVPMTAQEQGIFKLLTEDDRLPELWFVKPIEVQS